MVKAFVPKRDKKDEKPFVTKKVSFHCALTRALLKRFFMLMSTSENEEVREFQQTNKTKLLRREKC